MKTPFLRWVLTTLAATVLQSVSGMVLVSGHVAAPHGSPGVVLAWALLSNGLIAGVLLGLAVRSRLIGRRLMPALFGLAFGVGYLLNIIEAVVFDVLPLATGVRILAAGALTSAGLSIMVAATTRCDPRPDDATAVEGSTTRPALWRFVAVAALHVVSYFSAGTLVYPFVAHFYETVTMPAVGTVALLQLLVRGPLLAGVIYLLLRFLIGSRTSRAVWVGATLSILAGIAPLLVPTTIFPDEVRWAHLVEVGVSNFLFGAAATGVLSARSRASDKV